VDHSATGASEHTRSRALTLTIAALGVVYGDIGTSPLYALKECFSPHYGLTTGRSEVLGILSLVFWVLTIIVSVKYLAVILRFHNKGEGGGMALMELITPLIKNTKLIGIAMLLGLFGAALLYGDGVITPAISVLSAVEGLEVVTPEFKPYVIPLTLVILTFLFVIQRHGTGGIGRIFGPFMGLWFTVLGVLGTISIIMTPEVIVAVNPAYAIEYFSHHGLAGALVMGSVFLVVTGGETVYADMGHFGASPIRRGWFILVFPALLLNYFGQGALLLREGTVQSTVANPFFHMVPSWGVLPLVVLATFATVIASQAVISGAFSLTWQALQLGYLPRFKVMHTSGFERGQIYIPFINWALFFLTILLVLLFRSSGNLAAAYGIAVSTAMILTSLLSWHAMRHIAGWSAPVAATLLSVFLIAEIPLFGANAIKVFDGGWVPLILAALILFIMYTWRRGRQILRGVIEKRNTPLREIIAEQIDSYKVVPGTAMYMSGYKGTAPPALITNLKYNRCRHETIVLLTVSIETVAHVEQKERIAVRPMPKNFYEVTLHYGFMDPLDLMEDLMYLPEYDIPVDITDAIFILGHESLASKTKTGMARWRKDIFIYLHRNSRMPSKYFGIPVKRVLEVGSHIEI
jgi:KUP system potassium uptake protein